MTSKTDSGSSGASDVGGKSYQSESNSARDPSPVVWDDGAAGQEKQAHTQAAAEDPKLADHPTVVVYGVPLGLGTAPANDSLNEASGEGSEELAPPAGEAHAVLGELAESGYERVFSGLSDELVEGLEDHSQKSSATPEPPTTATEGESFLVIGLDIADLIADYDNAQRSVSDQDAAHFDHYLATTPSPMDHLVLENITIEIEDYSGTDVIA